MENLRRINDKRKKGAMRISVIEKVEIQNPYIRQFGKKNFQVQSYLDEVLSKNDTSMIKQEYKGLKKSHQSLQKEIGNFLFTEYKSFLTTSEKLEEIKYQIDDAKAILSQYHLVLNSFKGQIERLEQSQSEWKSNILSSEANNNMAIQKQDEDIIYQIQEKLNIIEQLVSLSKFQETMDMLKQVNEKIEEIEDIEQQVIFRAQCDQLRNNVQTMLAKQITLHARQNDIKLGLSLDNGLLSSQSYLNYQTKIIQNKLRKLEPMVFTVNTMQQCVSQQQRMQQMISTFIDFINTVSKDFKEKFLHQEDNSDISIKVVFSQWLKTLTEQHFSQTIALYIQNDLITYKLAENLKLLMRLIFALQTTNINIQQSLERSVSPMVLISMEKLLNERVQNQKQEKGLKKHSQRNLQAVDCLFLVDKFHLKTIQELEEEKKEEQFESVLMFQSLRKHFFRKMLRFLVKSIIQTMDFKTYQYISIQISNIMFTKFINCLNAITQREELQMQQVKLDVTKSLINEYSSIQVMLNLQRFFKESDFKVIPMNQEKLLCSIEDQRLFYHQRFLKLFQKDFLIRLVQSLLKEPNLEKTYFSEEVLDYTKIEPSYTFIQISQYLGETVSKFESDLSLDDENQRFDAKIVFKERLVMFILLSTLDILRDIFFCITQDESIKIKKYSEFKDYIDKIIVDKKFTARYMNNSGVQHLMFGIWYIVLSFTVGITMVEVKKSIESDKLMSLLNQLTQEIQSSRRSIANKEDNRKSEFNMDAFKTRISTLINIK